MDLEAEPERLTVSTAELLRPFARMNRGKSYAHQVKPHNFLLTAHVLPLGQPTDADVNPEHFQLVAPWDPDPRHWGRLRWLNRHDGRPYAITTVGQGGPGLARVMTHREYIALYESHPESKSVGPDDRPCGRGTVGELKRRPVRGVSLAYVGKESNRLDEREAGMLHDEDDYLATYIDADETTDWPRALRGRSTAELARLTGRDRSTIKRWKSGQAKPSRRHLAEARCPRGSEPIAVLR